MLILRNWRRGRKLHLVKREMGLRGDSPFTAAGQQINFFIFKALYHLYIYLGNSLWVYVEQEDIKSHPFFPSFILFFFLYRANAYNDDKPQCRVLYLLSSLCNYYCPFYHYFNCYLCCLRWYYNLSLALRLPHFFSQHEFIWLRSTFYRFCNSIFCSF